MDVSQLPLNQIEAAASNVRNLCYVIYTRSPAHDATPGLRGRGAATPDGGRLAVMGWIAIEMRPALASSRPTGAIAERF
jgi:hypothetical protein